MGENSSVKEVEMTGIGKPAKEESQEESHHKYDLPARKCHNLYSGNEVLRNISEYVLDWVTYHEYKEDTFFSNIRLLLSTLACIVALYASFGIPFPEEIHLLAFSLVVFFSLLFLLFWVESYFIQNSIITIKDTDGETLFVDAYLDRESSNLVLELRQKNGKVSSKETLARYIDSEGYVFVDNLFDDLKMLFNKFPNEKLKNISKNLKIKK